MNRLMFGLCTAVGCAFVLQFPATAIAGKVATEKMEKVVYSFDGTDGEYPEAGVVKVKGTLYGTTEEGGSYGDGAVFALVRKTGAETVLHSFSGGTDGERPYAGLIEVKGTLYGTTAYGGASGGGTVFSVDPTTGAETVVYTFCSQPGCADGELPFYGGLIPMRGTLYGTTWSGGTIGGGTVFSVDPTTGAETVLHSFGSDTDGADPVANLIDVNGTLYGTTWAGGTYGNYGGYGTVFSVDPTTGAETVLHSFGSGTDGQYPNAGLIDVNGTLWGTTGAGGTYGYGTVFSVNPTTGAETVVYSFCSQRNCPDGEDPLASLIDVNGTLYGTTETGGASEVGTVFSVNPTTGAETVVYSFCSQQECADGDRPVANLTDVHGKLYGTTLEGGAGSCEYGCGTVFEIKEH
ncbi:MAG TPA: choice-of-anchor tandem repeat GloVer-containing protein [Rhizomicrobium sp.]|jgi:uncharacterized repeat protein (TIGR03803 family)|nr:choice-of-anchor tandem repeat GloVer-containing protein [Rhizomicrobium sp.]